MIKQETGRKAQYNTLVENICKEQSLPEDIKLGLINSYEIFEEKRNLKDLKILPPKRLIEIGQLLSDKLGWPNEKIIPPKIQEKYFNIKEKVQASQSNYYLLYEGTCRRTNEVHYIRILNRENSFVQKNQDLALTYYIQELLRLCITTPQNIFIETFEFWNNAAAFAIKPYTSLREEATKNGSQMGIEIKDIAKMTKDILKDMNFFLEKLEGVQLKSLITQDNIFKFKEDLPEHSFFVGDWAKHPFDVSGSKEEDEFVKSDGFNALGLTALELKGVPSGDLEKFNQMTGSWRDIAFQAIVDNAISESNEFKKLVNKLLSKDTSWKPNLYDLSSEIQGIISELPDGKKPKNGRQQIITETEDKSD